jgi:hypothetical protein
MLQNYDRLSGALRPKPQQVPSDELRKSLMLFDLLDLVQARRADIDAHDARAACST